MRVLIYVCALLWAGMAVGWGSEIGRISWGLANEAKVLQQQSLNALAMHAVLENDLSRLKQLVADGADINATLQSHQLVTEYSLSEGNSLLHMAAGGDNLALVQFLVEQGAKLDYLNVEGLTPISYARGFMGRAYDKDKEKDSRVLDYLYAKGVEQGKLLHEAVNDMRFDDVKHALANGADVNAPAPNGKASPLQAIAGESHHGSLSMKENEKFVRTEMARVLIEGGADVNPRGGYTPLYWAVKTQNPSLVELLLDNNAYPDKEAYQTAQQKLKQGNNSLSLQNLAPYQVPQEKIRLKSNSLVAYRIVELLDKFYPYQNKVIQPQLQPGMQVQQATP